LGNASTNLPNAGCRNVIEVEDHGETQAARKHGFGSCSIRWGLHSEEVRLPELACSVRNRFASFDGREGDMERRHVGASERECTAPK
jgi:hypothetical protein